jgi:hypothetical protein
MIRLINSFGRVFTLVKFKKKLKIHFFCNFFQINFIYIVGGMSGGPGITGWLINLFPYLTCYGKIKINNQTSGNDLMFNPRNRLAAEADYIKNEYCWNGNSWKDAMGENGLSTSVFNYSLNKVPFEFLFGDTGVKVDLNFLGGLMGVSVCKTDNALLPIFGYAVTQPNDSTISKKK